MERGEGGYQVPLSEDDNFTGWSNAKVVIEEAKIHCAREHFRAISGNNVVYDVVDSYQTLLKLVTQ